MSDMLRSAFNNLSSNVWSNDHNSDSSYSDNPFVGQTIDLNANKYRVERVIAEGGFGFVFRVIDIKSSAVYALKRLIASDSESKKEIENEIQVLTRLQPHNHIMSFISWGKINQNIYLLLCEYCGCGSLKDITLPIGNHSLLNRIAYQTCLAIERMHSLGITHRDLKIENILFDNNGIIKLCDFGSATTDSFLPDLNWTPIQRSLLEDEMSRHTTPMYRPPEILDTYLHLPINTAIDIWAFGCLLFCLKFGRHPFEDSAKLRIINCKYSFPNNTSDSDLIVRIIKMCIRIDPNERTNATDIIGLIEEDCVDLNSPCVNPRQPTPTQPIKSDVTHDMNKPLPQIPGSAQPSFSFSGFTRYIKDTSNKVMQTVQNSIARQELDLETNRCPKPIVKPQRPPPPKDIKVETKSEEITERETDIDNKIESNDSQNIPKNNFFETINWEESNDKVLENEDIVSIAENDKPNKPALNDLLLNLSIDETTTHSLNPISDTNDLPNDLFAIKTSKSNLNDQNIKIDNYNTKLNTNLLPDVDFFSESTSPPTAPLCFDPNNVLKPNVTLSPTSVPTLNNMTTGLQRNTSTPNLNLDPLAQLDSFVTTKVTNLTKPNTPSIPRVNSYTSFQSTAPLKPDYNRNNFVEITDLLGGFKPLQNDTNKTISQLRKEEMLKDGNFDPNKLKIMEWKENKTRNIRALLCSLNTITWDGCNWQPIGMHQLVATNDVKKCYRRACLAVHPDKLVGTEHEELAKLIFMELNDAWTEFEKQIQ
ncbi:cyclin-G-associated kinase-like isoform X2 [Oppia nitens]|uniref:cyclin-G-associated kinase-like isoform X2 n=1 Tax=Oppia nitens TaxID=1686743 RepID=UPI0023DC32AD|nr:cyclin-G-associated kinase-like isoform X2 [Oppia nitens]